MLSPHDPVTDLVDLREFGRLLEVEIGRAERHARPLSVALVALECGGDRTGDARRETLVRRATGHLLERFLRAHDVACRADGDQFAVLLPETDVEGAFACFERLLLELDLTEVAPVPGIGASVGIATLEAGHTAVELFALASQALDAVRGQGHGGAAVALSAGLEGSHPPAPA